MRLNQVTLACSDIDRGVRFYRALGLAPVVLSPHYARLVCPVGQATLSLHWQEHVTASDSVIYFECEQLDQTVADLQAAGTVFESGPRDETWLWREARLHDPDGNRLCLYWAGPNRLDPPWRVDRASA